MSAVTKTMVNCLSENPLISVIIPTYQREGVLLDSIQTLLKQDYPHFEILVIDQTQDHHPETIAALESLEQNRNIQWLKVDWASLPRARNYGIRHAQGEIIIFIDDDVQVPSQFLRHHLANYQRDRTIGAVAGRVFDRMKLADSQRIYNSEQPYEIDYLPPEARDAGLAWYHLDLVHTTQPQRVISARGCNMSFRRTLFTDYGLRFDERFRGNAVREESDCCLRIRSTGLIIWYDPAAYLVHLGEETGGCQLETRSLEYQLNFYHNHFLMALKNLTPSEQWRMYRKFFDCHVLGNPPCYKEKSLNKMLVRGFFFGWGYLAALKTHWLSFQTNDTALLG